MAGDENGRVMLKKIANQKKNLIQEQIHITIGFIKKKTIRIQKRDSKKKTYNFI